MWVRTLGPRPGEAAVESSPRCPDRPLQRPQPSSPCFSRARSLAAVGGVDSQRGIQSGSRHFTTPLKEMRP